MEKGLRYGDIAQFLYEKGLCLSFFFSHMTQAKASPDNTPHAQPSQYIHTQTKIDDVPETVNEKYATAATERR